MMQCVTHNKSFLFSPRLKTLKNKSKRYIYPYVARISFECSWNERH